MFEREYSGTVLQLGIPHIKVKCLVFIWPDKAKFTWRLYGELLLKWDNYFSLPPYYSQVLLLRAKWLYLHGVCMWLQPQLWPWRSTNIKIETRVLIQLWLFVIWTYMPCFSHSTSHVRKRARGRQPVGLIFCLCPLTAIMEAIFEYTSHDDVIRWKLFSALLAFCAGNSPVTGEFPSQRPATRGFDVFFYLRLNKRLSKQSRRRGF